MSGDGTPGKDPAMKLDFTVAGRRCPATGCFGGARPRADGRGGLGADDDPRRRHLSRRRTDLVSRRPPGSEERRQGLQDGMVGVPGNRADHPGADRERRRLRHPGADQLRSRGVTDGGLQAYILGSMVDEKPGYFSVFWATLDNSRRSRRSKTRRAIPSDPPRLAAAPTTTCA